MPVHKNSIRQKKITISFSGTYARSSNALSYSVFGIVQDFVTAGTYINMGYTEALLPLTFSGVSGGTERIDNSSGNVDRWVVNCMNNTDANHEYSAEDIRDSALACFQNLTWHNYASGSDFTPTQLGTWSGATGVTVTGEATYDIIWTPNAGNTAAFADDHPATVFGISNHYIDIEELLLTASLDYDNNFLPTTAVYDGANVTMTVGSTALMATNKYWDEGREYGSADELEDVPSWIGQVTSKTTSGSTTTIVLKVSDGFNYLQGKIDSNTSPASNSILGLLQEEVGTHLIVHRYGTELHMLDQITTANLGYTVEGHCTEADINGSVLTGKNTETYNVLDVTVTSVNDSNGAFIEVFNISNDVLSGTTSEISQLRIRNNSGNNVTFGGTRAFVNLPFIASETPLVRLTKAVAIMNSASVIDVVCTISGTDNNAVLRVVPRNTTLTWGTVSKSGAWGGSAAVSSTVPDIATSLSLALDPNRIGTRTGITLIDEDYVSRTTDYGALPNLTFARGSSLTLGNGFVLDIGKGYDFTGDAKDLTVTIEDNAILKVSGQAKENMWGNKFTIDSGGNLVVITPVATTDNPVNVIQRTGGALVANFNPALNAPVTGNRTFLYGRSQAQRDSSIIWTVDNGSTGIYNSLGIPFIYTMAGDKLGQTFVFNSPSAGTSTYVPSNGIKQFTGDTLYFGDNNNNFQFSTAAFDNATIVAGNIAFTYDSQWVVIGMKLLGNVTDTLEAYNPVTNYLIIDVENDDGIYSDGWNFKIRPATSKGIATLARLWNPIFTYGGEAITNFSESYYYGTGTDETTLVSVKEGCEPNAIGTVGINNHPFNDAITISDDYGLAGAVISGAGINKYKSDNNGTTSGWGDSNSDRDGLALVFAQGTRPPESTSEGEGTNLTASVQDTDWFCYSKRDGYRPRIITESFGNSLSAYQPVTPMEPFLDIYWQANTVSAIDAYVATFETALWAAGPPSYTSGTTLLTLNVPTTVTWNEVYRFIEYAENNNLITNANLASETRAFDIINGRFRRFINTDVPVNTSGDINIPDYNLELELNGSVSRSTGSNSIRGIDIGISNEMTFKSTSAGTFTIEGDFKAQGFTFTETDGTIKTANSVFNNTDAQNYTIEMDNTVINSVGNVELSDVTDEVTINTNSNTVISAVATDLSVNGTSDITVSANTTDSKFGTISNKVTSLTQSASLVSVGDNAQLTGSAVLSNNVTDAIVDAGGSIGKAGTSGLWTNCDLEAVTTITGNGFSGGKAKCGGDFTSSTLGSTTVEATGNVTISASATGSTGIGIIGNAISVAGDTDSCKISAVTTFVTNDITGGSDVTAGTSVTAQEIDDSKVVSPIVACDYIQNGANITASTSLDVDVSMTGGTVSSADIDITVDFTGGTATSSGDFTVPLISGAQTTCNAGKLILTTLTSGFVNFSGNGSTVTNINGGIFGGTGDLTTTSQIGNASFGTNVTLLSVPTNTNSTRHVGNYSDMKMEMTNSGSVQFDNSATGVVSITKGPSSGTTIVRKGGITMTIVADDGSNNTDNVEFSEEPFDVNIIPPSGGNTTRYKVQYGSTTTAVLTGTLSLSESVLDRGDTIKIAGVRDGFSNSYQSVTVGQIVENGIQTVDITTTTPEPVPIDNTGDVTEDSYSFDTTNNWVIMAFSKIPQTSDGNLIMNKFMTTQMKTSTNAGATLDAILHFEDASWYRSGGVDSGQFIDPLKVKTISTDGSNADNAQIYPNYIILGTSTNIQDLTDQDDFLTTLPFAVGVTTKALATATLPMFKRTSRVKPVNNITDE